MSAPASAVAARQGRQDYTCVVCNNFFPDSHHMTCKTCKEPLCYHHSNPCAYCNIEAFIADPKAKPIQVIGLVYRCCRVECPGLVMAHNPRDLEVPEGDYNWRYCFFCWPNCEECHTRFDYDSSEGAPYHCAKCYAKLEAVEEHIEQEKNNATPSAS